MISEDKILPHMLVCCAAAVAEKGCKIILSESCGSAWGGGISVEIFQRERWGDAVVSQTVTSVSDTKEQQIYT